MAAAPRGLHTLARLYRVQTAYRSADGDTVQATPDALMAALRALRVPIAGADDIQRLIRHRQRELWERVIEPVVVRWAGDPDAHFLLRVPARLRDEPVQVRVGLEEGGEQAWSVEMASLEVAETAEPGGLPLVALRVPLRPLPTGYHDLVVEVGSGRARRRHQARLIVAPRQARGWDVLERRPAWGLFAPLYALWDRGRDSAGMAGADIPTFHDLARLADGVAERGGAVVGTLPLLAAFLDRPYEPSPYAPVSRLFWNELYVDPERALADAGVDDPLPPGELRFADAGKVDPKAGMQVRRRILEGLVSQQPAADAELEAFRARNPAAEDYARFRALVERWGVWSQWPDWLRARDVRPDDYDPDVARYHMTVQWLAERQLAEASEQAESRGVGLYLDLPLGVHPEGYDVWRERELFATSASAGAPPDALAAGGQDWGFPPLHPEASRMDGHRYFVASIRNHLRFSRVLRVDHVMQLRRMYWVPEGDSRNGVYVRNPEEELYAVLCLESHRAGAVVVGEDLGTVPREIRRGMRRHGLPGMYVGQFELTEGETEGGLVPQRVKPGALASIGTHDTPTFAGWWLGRDIEIRRDLGEVDDEEADAQLEARRRMRERLARGLGVASATGGEEMAAVQESMLRFLGGSPAGLVLATMEDLWLETEPQNVPGTTGDWNWRRQAARPMGALEDAGVARFLNALNEAREGSE